MAPYASRIEIDRLGKLWKHAPPRSDRADHRKLMCDDSMLKTDALFHHIEWRFAKLIFENAQLRLSPVADWTDPYEKAWTELLFNRPQSPLKGAHAYGLCWTLTTFDEPAWRMHGFSRSQPMVRLRFHTRELLQAARGQLEREPGSWFLGSVRYCRTKQLDELAKLVANESQKDVSRNAATMLVHKRNAFRFEKEVRLLYIDPPGSQPRSEIFLPMNPAADITQVMSSPYATKKSHGDISRALRAHGMKVVSSGVLAAPDWDKL